MSATIVLLHSGNGEPGRVAELAAALGRLGSTVTVEDLASGDYDKILDAVARADTVAFWPEASAAKTA